MWCVGVRGAAGHGPSSFGLVGSVDSGDFAGSADFAGLAARSDSECLGAALHFRAAILAERLRGGARQGRVGSEQPLQHFFVGEAVVPEEGEGTGQALDDLVAVDEGGRDVQGAVLTAAYG